MAYCVLPVIVLEDYLKGISTNTLHAYTRKNITPSKPVSPILLVCKLFDNSQQNPFSGILVHVDGVY